MDDHPMDDPIGRLLMTGEPEPQQNRPSKRVTRGGKKKKDQLAVQETEAGPSQQTEEESVVPPEAKKQKKRGATRGMKANKGPPTKPVDFNQFNQPHGNWKNDFTAYGSHLVKSYCNINHNWKQVPQSLKDTMFQRLQSRFSVDPALKKDVLSAMSKQFRDQKNKLADKFIYKMPTPEDPDEPDHGGDGERPPWEVYEGITEEQWLQFVERRHTPEFQALRVQQQANAKKNLYPHHLGGKSIAQRVPEWEQKGYLPTDGSLDASGRRMKVWELSHIPKNSTPENPQYDEATRAVIAQMGELSSQLTQGTWTSQRNDDPLTRALGKKDHPGRAIGFGGHVGIRQAFGTPGSRISQGKSISYEEHLRALAEMEQRITQNVDERIAQAISRIQPQQHESQEVSRPPVDQSPIQQQSAPVVRGSVHSADLFPYASLKAPTECHLFLQIGVEEVMVAWGKLFPSLPSDIVHGEPLRHYHARVLLDKFVAEHADVGLPVPIPQRPTLRSAQTATVQWPVRLIRLPGQDMSRPKTDKGKGKRIATPVQSKASTNFVLRPALVEKRILAGLSTNMQILHSSLLLLPPDSDSLTVEDPERIFHYIVQGEDIHRFGMYMSDFEECFRRDWLNVSIIKSAAMWVHDKAINVYEDQRFGFLCPAMCSAVQMTSDMQGLMQYMMNALFECSNKSFIMLPYHSDRHWSLLVLVMSKHPRILQFDSLGRGAKRPKISTAILGSMRAALSLQGITMKSTIPWNTVKCPVQPGGSECGYFVMRFMSDIVGAANLLPEHSLVKAYEEVFKGGQYDDAQIVEMLEEWSEFVCTSLMN